MEALVSAALSGKSKRAKWVNIDVKQTAASLGAPKLQVPRMLNELADSGAIILGRAGKIRSRYQILKRPSQGADMSSIVSHLHEKVLELEQRDLGRLEQVVQLLCSGGGLEVSKGLSQYFGDEEELVQAAGMTDAAAEEAWGSCRDSALATGLAGATPSDTETQKNWMTVLKLLEEPAILPSDDPYLLARFAVGVKSPRITKLKLGAVDGFGCCSDCPFPDVLGRAVQVVEEHEG
ncbi:unnamed protein product [Chrysoparadoxa australica]